MSDSPRVRVEFLPSGVVAWATSGKTVLEVARECGIVIAASCGSRGICGTCGVKVVDGDLAPPDAEETRGLSRGVPGVRLACRARIVGPVTIRPVVTLSSLAASSAGSSADTVLGVDLGTTSVACAAVEVRSGRESGNAMVPNRMQGWGADVLSRIAAAVAGEAEALRDAAVDSVLEACTAAAGGAPVSRVVVAANTAMAALLSGTDVTSLASHPFELPQVPRVLPAESVVSRGLGGAEVVIVPPLAGFVGGDVLAGLVHTGMLYAELPTLLIDLGTNAEIALASAGELRVASAAAGPAFEGVGVECGGPAVPGAVSRIDADADGTLTLQTIGAGSPVWLSGSGLISAVAVLRRLGHLTEDGLMVPEGGPMSTRFFTREDGIVCVRLSEDGRVVLSQTDIRTFQLAKAAVRAGIEAVLADAGVASSSIERVYVAGAFGGAVPADDLESLGLVPVGATKRLEWVGNASLAGAVAGALDPEVLSEAIMRSSAVRHVDLAMRADFSASLMRAVTLAPFDA